MDNVTFVGCNLPYTDRDAEGWCAVKGLGFVCEDCQYDACAHFGQIRSNIAHTSLFHDLVLRYLTDEGDVT